MTKNNPEIRIIGRCKVDIQAILKEMPEIIYAETSSTEETKETYKKIWSSHYKDVYEAFADKADRNIYSEAYEKTFHYYLWLHDNLSREEAIRKISEGFLECFGEDVEAMDAMHLTFKCYFKADDICIISLSGKEDSFWLFPSRYVDIEEYKDYRDFSGSERKAALNGETDVGSTDILPTENISYNDAVALKANAETDIAALKGEMDDVKNAKTGELAEIQARIDKLTEQLESKKRSLLDELESKKQEMEEKLENLEKEVFRLDSEIYAIRCYTGEIVEVNQIKSGRAVKDDTPIVIYQKLRYLDEELGKIASLYNVDFSDTKYFETLISSRDDVLETFLPAKRSIVFVKVSKTGKGFRNTEYPGLLENFDKYHGNKIAILIRDGDNLYIAWTDDERINFAEDAFYKPGTRVLEDDENSILTQGKYESDREYDGRIKAYQKKALKESLGRYFAFSLLQGMLDRGLIKLPQKVNISDSEYVIFSMADGWLNDNKYYTFEDMIKRCNVSVKTGDAVLMTTRLFARSGNAYKNDRGRGYADRTHDVSAKDKEIYKINLAEHLADYEYVDADSGESSLFARQLADSEYKEQPDIRSIRKIEGTDTYRFYISLLKEYSWSGEARANFQVYSDEFINLTFMNSAWLEYVLTNNKAGHVRIGGSAVDFAYTIPYIKKALAYVREREKVTAAQIEKIDPDILQDNDWPAALSEWMLEKDVHNFSEYQTKRFCKSYRQKKTASPSALQ